MRTERALALIEKEGRTKRWLAERCGIELISLNHILAGRRNPSRPVLILMANALETTPEDLQGDSEEETIPERKIAPGS